MKIYYESKFKKDYKKLPDNIRTLAKKKEKIFRENPFDSRLKTHKLHGLLFRYWAFSINNKYRIVFKFADSNTVYFLTVGTHDIYK